MFADFEPEYVAPTPAEVLAILRDEHRQQCEHDCEADPNAELTFATTIHDWRWACDLLGWRQLSRALNTMWGISEPDRAWCAVLEPAKKRTLGDLCEFLASRAKAPRVRPARLLGGECRSAGAFLIVRTMLKRAGADVERLSPSTPLAEYTRRHIEVFLGPVSRLAPGALPPVKVRIPAHWACAIGQIVGIALLLGIGGLGWLTDTEWPRLTIFGVLLTGFAYAAGWFSARCILPRGVAFGDLQTFRDLATCIARHAAPQGA